MKVYQLKAEGTTNCEWYGEIYTTTVFTTRELAEQRIEKFKAMASDPDRLDAIINPKITVIELEVVE